jgi:hypothetical protein
MCISAVCIVLRIYILTEVKKKVKSMEALRPFHTFAQIFVIFFHYLLNRREAAKQYFYFSFSRADSFPERKISPRRFSSRQAPC